MYQYDDQTVTASLPVSTAAGIAGYFTDGSPAGGQAATILRAEFMNAIMMEIINAITGAGITLSKSNHTQLKAAIQAYVSAATVSQASETVSGKVELATPAEALGGTDTTRAVTSAGLASAKTLAANGYYKFPGGMIVQWGTVSSVGTDSSSSSISYPVTFPNAVINITSSHVVSSASANAAAYSTSSCCIKSGYTTSSFQLVQDSAAGNAVNEFWVAIGY